LLRVSGDVAFKKRRRIGRAQINGDDCQETKGDEGDQNGVANGIGVAHVEAATEQALQRGSETLIRNTLSDALIRISVGIENPDDLIVDLDQALR
jgi:hypothetical protein